MKSGILPEQPYSTKNTGKLEMFETQATPKKNKLFQAKTRDASVGAIYKTIETSQDSQAGPSNQLTITVEGNEHGTEKTQYRLRGPTITNNSSSLSHNNYDEQMQKHSRSID